MVAEAVPDNRSDNGTVELQHAGPIATLTLTRPRKRNAMSLAMWAQLADHVLDIQKLDSARVIVIRGAEQYFSAGGDLTEVLAATASQEAASYYCHTVVRALHAVAGSDIPTVSAINGVASGGGVEIAIASDVRIAIATATLQLPMSHLGVVPDEITLSRLIRAMGPARTQWMLLHGRPVDARTCFQIGLIEELLPLNDFDDAVSKLAGEIARTAPLAQRRTGDLLRDDLVSIQNAAAPMIESFLSGEVAAAARRFLDRSSIQRGV